ncbi:MAG: hypothetical protein NT145_05890, partial [Elusimicrobia bacterium]|nr:hypothetical protein [Elusimicrobiota bacterium]
KENNTAATLPSTLEKYGKLHDLPENVEKVMQLLAIDEEQNKYAEIDKCDSETIKLIIEDSRFEDSVRLYAFCRLCRIHGPYSKESENLTTENMAKYIEMLKPAGNRVIENLRKQDVQIFRKSLLDDKRLGNMRSTIFSMALFLTSIFDLIVKGSDKKLDGNELIFALYATAYAWIREGGTEFIAHTDHIELGGERIGRISIENFIISLGHEIHHVIQEHIFKFECYKKEEYYTPGLNQIIITELFGGIAELHSSIVYGIGNKKVSEELKYKERFKKLEECSFFADDQHTGARGFLMMILAISNYYEIDIDWCLFHKILLNTYETKKINAVSLGDILITAVGEYFKTPKEVCKSFIEMAEKTRKENVEGIESKRWSAVKEGSIFDFYEPSVYMASWQIFSQVIESGSLVSNQIITSSKEKISQKPSLLALEESYLKYFETYNKKHKDNPLPKDWLEKAKKFEELFQEAIISADDLIRELAEDGNITFEEFIQNPGRVDAAATLEGKAVRLGVHIDSLKEGIKYYLAKRDCEINFAPKRERKAIQRILEATGERAKKLMNDFLGRHEGAEDKVKTEIRKQGLEYIRDAVNTAVNAALSHFGAKATLSLLDKIRRWKAVRDAKIKANIKAHSEWNKDFGIPAGAPLTAGKPQIKKEPNNIRDESVKWFEKLVDLSKKGTNFKDEVKQKFDSIDEKEFPLLFVELASYAKAKNKSFENKVVKGLKEIISEKEKDSRFNLTDFFLAVFREHKDKIMEINKWPDIFNKMQLYSDHFDFVFDLIRKTGDDNILFIIVQKLLEEGSSSEDHVCNEYYIENYYKKSSFSETIINELAQIDLKCIKNKLKDKDFRIAYFENEFYINLWLNQDDLTPGIISIVFSENVKNIKSIIEQENETDECIVAVIENVLRYFQSNNTGKFDDVFLGLYLSTDNKNTYQDILKWLPISDNVFKKYFIDHYKTLADKENAVKYFYEQRHNLSASVSDFIKEKNSLQWIFAMINTFYMNDIPFCDKLKVNLFKRLLENIDINALAGLLIGLYYVDTDYLGIQCMNELKIIINNKLKIIDKVKLALIAYEKMKTAYGLEEINTVYKSTINFTLNMLANENEEEKLRVLGEVKRQIKEIEDKKPYALMINTCKEYAKEYFERTGKRLRKNWQNKPKYAGLKRIVGITDAPGREEPTFWGITQTLLKKTPNQVTVQDIQPLLDLHSKSSNAQEGILCIVLAGILAYNWADNWANGIDRTREFIAAIQNISAEIAGELERIIGVKNYYSLDLRETAEGFATIVQIKVHELWNELFPNKAAITDIEKEPAKSVLNKEVTTISQKDAEEILAKERFLYYMALPFTFAHELGHYLFGLLAAMNEGSKKAFFNKSKDINFIKFALDSIKEFIPPRIIGLFPDMKDGKLAERPLTRLKTPYPTSTLWKLSGAISGWVGEIILGFLSAAAFLTPFIYAGIPVFLNISISILGVFGIVSGIVFLLNRTGTINYLKKPAKKTDAQHLTEISESIREISKNPTNVIKGKLTTLRDMVRRWFKNDKSLVTLKNVSETSIFAQKENEVKKQIAEIEKTNEIDSNLFEKLSLDTQASGEFKNLLESKNKLKIILNAEEKYYIELENNGFQHTLKLFFNDEVSFIEFDLEDGPKCFLNKFKTHTGWQRRGYMQWAMYYFWLYLKALGVTEITTSGLKPDGEKFLRNINEKVLADKEVTKFSKLEGVSDVYTAVIDLNKVNFSSMKENLKPFEKLTKEAKPFMAIGAGWVKKKWGEKAHEKYVKYIAPIWETVAFQWAGIIISLLGFPWIGILWATIGFAIAHTILEWKAKSKDKGWKEITKEIVLKFLFRAGFGFLLFLPFAGIASIIALIPHITALIKIILTVIIAVPPVYKIHSKINSYLFNLKQKPDDKLTPLRRKLKKLPYLSIKGEEKVKKENNVEFHVNSSLTLDKDVEKGIAGSIEKTHKKWGKRSLSKSCQYISRMLGRELYENFKGAREVDLLYADGLDVWKGKRKWENPKNYENHFITHFLYNGIHYAIDATAKDSVDEETDGLVFAAPSYIELIDMIVDYYGDGTGKEFWGSADFLRKRDISKLKCKYTYPWGDILFFNNRDIVKLHGDTKELKIENWMLKAELKYGEVLNKAVSLGKHPIEIMPEDLGDSWPIWVNFICKELISDDPKEAVLCMEAAENVLKTYFGVDDTDIADIRESYAPLLATKMLMEKTNKATKSGNAKDVSGSKTSVGETSEEQDKESLGRLIDEEIERLRFGLKKLTINLDDNRMGIDWYESMRTVKPLFVYGQKYKKAIDILINELAESARSLLNNNLIDLNDENFPELLNNCLIGIYEKFFESLKIELYKQRNIPDYKARKSRDIFYEKIKLEDSTKAFGQLVLDLLSSPIYPNVKEINKDYEFEEFIDSDGSQFVWLRTKYQGKYWILLIPYYSYERNNVKEKTFLLNKLNEYPKTKNTIQIHPDSYELCEGKAILLKDENEFSIKDMREFTKSDFDEVKQFLISAISKGFNLAEPFIALKSKNGFLAIGDIGILGKNNKTSKSYYESETSAKEQILLIERHAIGKVFAEILGKEATENDLNEIFSILSDDSRTISVEEAIREFAKSPRSSAFKFKGSLLSFLKKPDNRFLKKNKDFYDSNISKGKGVGHYSVNEGIWSGKRYWIFGEKQIYVDHPTVIKEDGTSRQGEDTNYTDIRKKESVFIEKALEVLTEKGLAYSDVAEYIRKNLNVVMVRPSDKLPLLVTNGFENYEALHGGFERKAIYISNGLYEKIKNNPILLAGAILHEGYELMKLEKAYEDYVANIEKVSRGFFKDNNTKLVGDLHKEAEKLELELVGEGKHLNQSKLDDEIQNLISLNLVSQIKKKIAEEIMPRSIPICIDIVSFILGLLIAIPLLSILPVMGPAGIVAFALLIISFSGAASMMHIKELIIKMKVEKLNRIISALAEGGMEKETIIKIFTYKDMIKYANKFKTIKLLNKYPKFIHATLPNDKIIENIEWMLGANAEEVDQFIEFVSSENNEKMLAEKGRFVNQILSHNFDFKVFVMIINYEKEHVGHDKKLRFYRGINSLLDNGIMTDKDTIENWNILLNDYLERFDYCANKDMVLIHRGLFRNEVLDKIENGKYDLSNMGVSTTGIKGIEDFENIIKSVMEKLIKEKTISLKDLSNPLLKGIIGAITGFYTAEWGHGSRGRENLQRFVRHFQFLEEDGEIPELDIAYQKAGDTSFMVHKLGKIEFSDKTKSIFEKYKVLVEKCVKINSKKDGDKLSYVKKIFIDGLDKQIKEMKQKMSKSELKNGNENRYATEKIREYEAVKEEIKQCNKMDEVIEKVIGGLGGIEKFIEKTVVEAVILNAFDENPGLGQNILNKLSEGVNIGSLSAIMELKSVFIKAHTHFDKNVKKPVFKLFNDIKEIEVEVNEVVKNRSSEKLKVEAFFTKGILGEMAGDIGDACYTREEDIMGESRITAVIFSAGEGLESRFVGSMLVLKNKVKGKPVLILRAINPTNEFLEEYSAEDFLQEAIAYVEKAAKEMGAEVLLSDESETTSNRDIVYEAVRKFIVNPKPVKLDEQEYFNDYDITNSCVRVASGKDQEPEDQPKKNEAKLTLNETYQAYGDDHGDKIVRDPEYENWWENPANEKAKRDCEQNFAPEHEAPELIGIAEGVWQIVKNGEMLLEKAL